MGAPAEQQTLADGLTIQDILLQARRFLLFLWRYKFLIVGLAVAGLALGIAGGFAMPREKSSRFQVRLSKAASENPIANYERNNVEFFRSAEQNFTSLKLIREALEQLGETNIDDSRLAEVNNRLSFYSVGYHTYEGRMNHPDQQWAVEYLQTHLNLFLDTEIGKTLSVIEAEQEFLNDELAKVETDLLESEEALKEFKEEHADGLPEQAKDHNQHLKGLRKRLIELQADLDQVQLELKLNKDKLTGEKLFVESKVISTQRAQPFQTKITETKKMIAEAEAAGVGADHPEMQRLRRLAAKLEELSNARKEEEAAVTDKEVEQKRNPIYESIQDVVYHLEIREQVILSEIEQTKTSLVTAQKIVDQLPGLEAKFRDLTRTYNVNQAMHDKIYQQQRVTRLQYDLERASAAARYDIILPPQAVYSSQLKIVAVLAILGLVAGAMGALAFGFFLEMRPLIMQVIREDSKLKPLEESAA